MTTKPHLIVRIPVGAVQLEGELNVPPGSVGIVIFAHDSGSGRYHPRNQSLAASLREAGLGTLLFDLLTRDEEAVAESAESKGYYLELLAGRLIRTVRWMSGQTFLPLGFFGANAGSGGALMAAAYLGPVIRAVVSRGGRPDLAAEALPQVAVPTLLLVGELDQTMVVLNQQAYQQLRCKKRLHLVPRASRLFEEPGTLADVAAEARLWFLEHLTQPPPK